MSALAPSIQYLRDLVAIPSVNPMGRDDMPADIFTKALPHESFSRYRDFLLGRE